MNPIFRNILAVLAGLLVGSMVNGCIIAGYPNFYPLPEEIVEHGLVGNSHLLEFPHLLFVFLAHGLGTLIGGFLAAKIGVSNHLILSMLVGGIFLLAGISVCTMLDFTPLLFSIIDILLAYVPMAWLGWKLAHPLNETPKNSSISEIIDGSLS